MLKIKANNKQYQCITSWDECSTSQWEELRNEKDFIKILSIITDIPIAVIKQLRQWHVQERILPEISFLTTWPDFPERCPDWLKIGEKKYRVPDDLGNCSFAQVQAVTDMIEENVNMDKKVSRVVAIYMFKQLTGKEYDEDMLDEVEQMVRKAKIMQVYPIACFFLRIHTGLMRYGKKRSRLLRLLRSSLERVFGSWTDLVYKVFYILLATVIFSTLIWYFLSLITR